MKIEGVSALTLGTRDMAASVAFYAALGFELKYGGGAAEFTSFYCGTSYLNLVAVSASTRYPWWGRVIFYVDDVDAFYAKANDCGFETEAPPRDAAWGERYFHVTDPDGHELSFARVLTP